MGGDRAKKIDPRTRARSGARRSPQALQRNSASFVFACRGGWTHMGVGSSGTVALVTTGVVCHHAASSGV